MKANELIFDIEEGDSVSSYRFTCLKLNMDGVEYDANQVMQSKNVAVLAKLVAMKSGIIEKFNDHDGLAEDDGAELVETSDKKAEGTTTSDVIDEEYQKALNDHF